MPSAAVFSHGPARTPSPARRLFDLVALEARDLGVVTAYALGVGLLSLATPIAVQALISVLSFGNLLQPIWVLSAILAAVLVFVAALKAAQTLMVELVSRRIFLRAALRIGQRVTTSPVGAIDLRLTSRFFDVVTIEKTSAVLLFDGITVVLQVLAGMVLLAVYHPLLLAFDVVLGVVVVLLVVVPGKSAVATALSESSAKYAVADHLVALAVHPSLFTTARGEKAAVRLTEGRLAEWLAARTRHFRHVLWQTTGFLLLQALAMTALLGLGGWLVVERELAVGQLVAAELVMAATVTSLARVGKLLQKLYDLLAGLHKLGTATDLGLEPPGTGHLSPSKEGLAIRAARPRHLVEVQSGEKVRLNGPEGAGKTRLLRALAALDDDAWSIELDGVPVELLDRAAVADLVVLLGPGRGLGPAVEGLVRETSLEENLGALGERTAAAALAQALAQVGLTEAVRHLPDRTATRLRADGAPLSGTEAKRLVVARVLLTAPRLVLMDRFLDDLPDAALDVVAPLLLGPEAPWTVLCVTEDPRVKSRLARSVVLGPWRDGAVAMPAAEAEG